MIKLPTLLAQHKNEVAHCARHYTLAKTNRESRRWLHRLKLHVHTVTLLEDIIKDTKP